jgi:hypothetical protein
VNAEDFDRMRRAVLWSTVTLIAAGAILSWFAIQAHDARVNGRRDAIEAWLAWCNSDDAEHTSGGSMWCAERAREIWPE